MNEPRKFAPNRYRRRGIMYLDHDDGGYNNTSTVMDGDNETGISISETGHSKFEHGHKRRVFFNNKEYPLLRDAIFAYEDSIKEPAA